MIEVSPQVLWHPGKVAFMDLESDPVAFRIAPRKIGVVRLKLQTRKPDFGNPKSQAQGRCAHPTAKVKHRLAGYSRASCCKKHRVGCRPIALQGLQKPQAAAQEFVVGQRIIGEHHRPVGMSLSRRTALARK